MVIISIRKVVARVAKILIADDNEQITSILANYAQKEGFETIIALDGEDALAKFNKYNTEIQMILYGA